MLLHTRSGSFLLEVRPVARRKEGPLGIARLLYFVEPKISG